ncbi:MAG: hypothetical protein Q9179_000300 [Wetmoreana sp. 5 TL-2023]
MVKQCAQQAPRRQLPQVTCRIVPPTSGVPVDEDEAEQFKPKNTMDTKQKLLHPLSAEILIKIRLHGELTSFRSHINSLYPFLPHATIDCVQAFFEKEAYRLARIDFEEGKIYISANDMLDPEFRHADAANFFSFDEFSRYREKLLFNFELPLVDLLAKLLERPEEVAIETKN